jgi:hypothetical protein
MEGPMGSWDDVKRQLERLRGRDRWLQVFGAETHRYVSHPLSRAELHSLEDHLGAKLPKEYRDFLREVGWGAGPYYGIMSSSAALAHFENDARRSLAQPFPFTRSQAEAIPQGWAWRQVLEAPVADWEA